MNCTYFFSPRGCLRGVRCPFIHPTNNTPVCRFERTLRGCLKGSNCDFRHLYPAFHNNPPNYPSSSEEVDDDDDDDDGEAEAAYFYGTHGVPDTDTDGSEEEEERREQDWRGIRIPSTRIIPPTYSEESLSEEEEDVRPLCNYDRRCRRRGPAHVARFRHLMRDERDAILATAATTTTTTSSPSSSSPPFSPASPEKKKGAAKDAIEDDSSINITGECTVCLSESNSHAFIPCGMQTFPFCSLLLSSLISLFLSQIDIMSSSLFCFPQSGHLCVCVDCAVIIQNSAKGHSSPFSCVVCRAKATALLRIYMC
jgi:hypothetical protein